MNDSHLHTHYDNLKVTRNAPPTVIRAAYKALSQMYHPDKNLGDDSAVKTMEIINVAYGVLSDPIKKEKYDRWLLDQEQMHRNEFGRSAGSTPDNSEASRREGTQTEEDLDETSSEEGKSKFESDDELSPEQAEQIRRRNAPRYYSISQAQSRVLVVFVGFLFRLLAMGTFMAVVILAVVAAANSL